MQFRKILKKLIDDMLPDWRDKFLCYKELKQQLKRETNNNNKRMKLTDDDHKEIASFVELCQQQIYKFNDFVLDKQEWYIIIIEVLEGMLVAAKDSKQDMEKVGRDLVNLHGEIILLINYTAFNYTGLVKILKKHDKVSGALVRVPFIQKVVNEPFFKTDVLNSLVKKCETMLAQHFSINNKQLLLLLSSTSASSTSTKEDEEKCLVEVPQELVDIKKMENAYMKSTLSALERLKEFRSRSSTVSMFSLPPIQQSTEMEDLWKKVSVVEEVV